MKVLLLISIVFSNSAVWSKVVDHTVTSKKIEIFTMKEACLFLGHTDLLLADKKDRTSLDCMGTYEKVSHFCEKKFPKEKTLTRGYIEPVSNQVICERGQNVILKVACDKRDLPLCKNPKKGCEKLRKIFAIRLEPFRSTLVKYLTGRALSCYYSVKENDTTSIQNLKEELK